VNGEIVFDGNITGMVFPKMGEVQRTPLEDGLMSGAGS